MLLISEFAEIFNAMESRIVGIVKIDGLVHGSAAKHENVVTLNEEVRILEAEFLGIFVSLVDQIANDLPFFTVAGSHEGKQSSVAQNIHIRNAADDGVIISAHVVITDHKL